MHGKHVSGNTSELIARFFAGLVYSPSEGRYEEEVSNGDAYATHGGFVLDLRERVCDKLITVVCEALDWVQRDIPPSY